MKEYFKTNDWDVDNADILHFQSKSNLKHKIKKQKKSAKHKESSVAVAGKDSSDSAIPLLKNSPRLQNVSPIKKPKNLTKKISKSSKVMLTKNDDLVNELSSQKIVKSNSKPQAATLHQKQNKKNQNTAGADAVHYHNLSVSKAGSNNNASESTLIKQTNFREKLQETLKGGRFRFINERLYTMKGIEAKQMFDQDSTAFASYHEGYRQQVERWPFNPLNRMIKKIRKSPKRFVIADFGCGEGRLAQSIKHKCFSIDLISVSDDVIACDMANTPLATSSIDVALYCLSLMGTNLNDFLLEANRVLKVGGFLYVAEIASRFDNVKNFFITVEKFGFKLLNKDLGDKFFYFFDFQKETDCSKLIMNEIELSLKPCIYKKR